MLVDLILEAVFLAIWAAFVAYMFLAEQGRSIILAPLIGVAVGVAYVMLMVLCSHETVSRTVVRGRDKNEETIQGE